ncbi:MAG: hypothetical protein IPH44_22585 [Myxococcales bacterium]|nr:hypothetical protein [Myxococcales bacterium]
MRARGMTPALNTNGYLLTRALIDALNDAGLYALQLSLDNLTPNAVSKKSPGASRCAASCGCSPSTRASACA